MGRRLPEIYNPLRINKTDMSLSLLQIKTRLAEMQDIIRTEALQAKADADKDKADMSRRLGSLHLAEATAEERPERIERQVQKDLEAYTSIKVSKRIAESC
jgi:hypothetical protein